MSENKVTEELIGQAQNTCLKAIIEGLLPTADEKAFQRVPVATQALDTLNRVQGEMRIKAAAGK